LREQPLGFRNSVKGSAAVGIPERRSPPVTVAVNPIGSDGKFEVALIGVEGLIGGRPEG
jgi:hypothetical protein